MARSPALLLLLILGFCCPGIQGQKYNMKVGFRGKSIKHPQMGQRLELECLSAKEDSGVSWLRLDKHGTLHFIVFISSLPRTVFSGNKETSTLEASKRSNSYWLVVKSFTLEDEGKYFCLMNSNQMLYFSPGQPVFFPVTTTVASITPAHTTQHGITQTDPCLKTRDAETNKEKKLNFSCDIIIWVPLAGACLLLLLALAVTVIACQQTRRRRCRCKRPVNGKPNAKSSMPNRHV